MIGTNGVKLHFFCSLEAQLEQEFIALNKWKFKIINNFILKAQFSVSIIIQLENGMILKAICDKDFPNEKPKVFVLNNFNGPNITPKTKEIEYFFQWQQNKKIITLISEIEEFYDRNKPKRDDENEQFYTGFMDIENLIDFTKGSSQKHNLLSETEHEEFEEKEIEFQEKKKTVNGLMRKIIEEIETKNSKLTR